MNTLCSLVEGVGSASIVCHKEIYKAVKICMTDRVLYVRVAAVKVSQPTIDVCSVFDTNVQIIIFLLWFSCTISNYYYILVICCRKICTKYLNVDTLCTILS